MLPNDQIKTQRQKESSGKVLREGWMSPQTNGCSVSAGDMDTEEDNTDQKKKWTGQCRDGETTRNSAASENDKPKTNDCQRQQSSWLCWWKWWCWFDFTFLQITKTYRNSVVTMLTSACCLMLDVVPKTSQFIRLWTERTNKCSQGRGWGTSLFWPLE